MPIIGSNQPGAGASPATSMAPQADTNPMSQIQAILQEIESSDIDAFFVDKQNTTQVKFDLNKVEATLDAYSQSSNNPQLFNKWLGLETSLTKSLKKFSSDLRMLLAEVTQMGQAQNMIKAQIPGEESGVATPSGQSQGQPQPGSTPSAPAQQGKIGAGERALPTEER